MLRYCSTGSTEVSGRAAQAVQAYQYNTCIHLQGFPRADIDVTAARADRHNIAGDDATCMHPFNSSGFIFLLCLNAVLSNDHKALMSAIEQLMYELHAEAKKAGPSAHPESTGTTLQTAAANAYMPDSSTASQLQLPFAVVDEVSGSSPAEEAGIVLGDQFLVFANVTKQTPRTLQAVAAAVQVYISPSRSFVGTRIVPDCTYRYMPQAGMQACCYICLHKVKPGYSYSSCCRQMKTKQ